MTAHFEAIAARVDAVWDDDILPALDEYIRIPCKSPIFAPDWEAEGEIDRAAALIHAWCWKRPIAGLTAEVVRLPGLTPVVLVEVPAFGDGARPDDHVLLYGHLDKQPELYGWRDGLGPWTPVREGDRLFGRGSADDGYAAFSALAAIEALQAAGGSHARCTLLVEASEESGSIHLPAYVEALADRIGTPSLVICLDSSCPTYDRLWVTTSLRGLVLLEVHIDVLTEGVHSGGAGGVVPDTLRVLRLLLDRIEDPTTGRVLLPALSGDVPKERRKQLESTGDELGDAIHTDFPWIAGAGPGDATPAQLLERKTWHASLAVTGLEGVPALKDAGNVLRPSIGAKLSVRIPPGVEPATARAALMEALETDPPYGARVTVRLESEASGWDAPPQEEWLHDALEDASQRAFGLPCRYIGEGGTIPFMAMLGERFPAAQFVVTGVLGPGSNAHGPNEFLDIPTGKRVTAAMAQVLAAHAARLSTG